MSLTVNCIMTRYTQTDDEQIAESLRESYESSIDFQIDDYRREQEEVFGV